MTRARNLLYLAAALGLALLPGPSRTQEPPPPEPVRSGLYVGAPSCGTSNCHGSVRPRRTFDVLQNEYFTWLKKDPHASRAFQVLFDPRSKTIAKNLQLETPPAETRLCLDCHAFAVPESLQVNRIDVEDGISCEACHGPASGWVRTHAAEDWDHRQSVEAGMTDLRNLGVRSRLCLSCHQGDGSKAVDHDLIAAGHPELVFELDNYTSSMPPHWTPLRETHGARAWAVGQAASFRQGLDLLAHRARNARWPEFSEMSCDACHHSLAEERWKKIRYDDRPGLPRWSPARWAVLRHLVAEVDPEAKSALDTDVRELARKVARIGSPPAEVAATAERMSRTLAGVLPALERSPWDDTQVRRLLLAISGDAEFLAGADRQSAEQAYLALHSLTGDLLGRNPRLARTGLPSALERLNRTLENPYEWKPDRFTGQLAQLRKQIQGLP
ncbi:MAG TPA: multiheme c-type cytochrome [Thermoanaerobaculia bacterium]|nr:multiheme c-type cytochrome [Thermoanaerobaculia bacterium]